MSLLLKKEFASEFEKGHQGLCGHERSVGEDVLIIFEQFSS